jgi:hypothetical protein
LKITNALRYLKLLYKNNALCLTLTENYCSTLKSSSFGKKLTLNAMSKLVFWKKLMLIHFVVVAYNKTSSIHYIEVTFRKKLMLYVISELLFKVTFSTFVLSVNYLSFFVSQNFCTIVIKFNWYPKQQSSSHLNSDE